MELWLKNYAEKNLAPKTLKRYKDILNSRIIPAIGKIKLEQLKPTHLLSFYNNLRENGIRKDKKTGGLSDLSILHHHRIISAILQDAVEWQLILSNPASRIKPPKVNRKEINFYTDDQVLQLLECVKNEHLKYQVVLFVEVFTGLRRGELLALEWGDINFETSTLKINKSLQYLPDVGVFVKSTKNISSDRVITLPSSVLSLLKEYKTWQDSIKSEVKEYWQESNKIFTQSNGLPMHPDSLTSWFHKFIIRYNLPPITLHGLRHTNASLLISQGVDIKNISRRLGHARTSTTVDIYGHALNKLDYDASNKLANLLIKDKEKSDINKEE